MRIGTDTYATRTLERPNAGAAQRLDAIATLARELANLAGAGDADAARVLHGAIGDLMRPSGDDASAGPAEVTPSSRAADRGAVILDFARARAAAKGRRRWRLR